MVLAVPQNVMPPNNGVVPCEGPRVIPTTLDFSKSSSYTFDLTGPFQQQQLSTCQCLYIDNSGAGAAAIVITINGSNQTLTIEPGTCGYYNIMMVNPPVLTLVSSNSTAKVYVAAMNFYIPGTVWGAGVISSGGLIGTVITTGNQPSISFSNIPSAYRDLVIDFNGRNNFNGDLDSVKIQFNGDVGNNYNWQGISGYGTSAPASFNSGVNPVSSINFGQIPGLTATANYSGSFEAVLPGYSRNTFYKQLVSKNGSTFHTGLLQNTGVLLWTGSWANAGTINSLVITPVNGTFFIDGTAVSLYVR